jgi:acid phosphatase (class A)
MKTILILFFIAAQNLAFAGQIYAVHPIAKNPVYLPATWAETLKTEIPPFPEKNSLEQKTDEQTLLEDQNKRKPQDCERAATEVHASLANLYGRPYGSLTDKQTQALTPFFAKVRTEGDYFTHQLKDKFTRPRPYTYLKQLHPCVELEKSFAYPSGHASLSELFALVLGEIFPTEKHTFLARAAQIRNDRVLAGVHHPTDIKNGAKIGDLIFAELMKNDSFKKDLEASRKLVFEH